MFTQIVLLRYPEFTGMCLETADDRHESQAERGEAYTPEPERFGEVL